MRPKLSALMGLALAGSVALVGCAPGATPQTTPEVTATAPHTITDHADAQVEIPAKITGVAFEQIPLVATYVAYFNGEAPNILATSKSLVNMMDSTMLAEIAPEALQVDTSFDNQGTINAETLLSLGPDVVFNNARNTKNRQAMEAAGLTVVGFDTMGAPTDTYVRWLRLLEDVFGEPGKNDAKIAYGDALINDAEARVRTVSDDGRRSALVVMQANQGKLVVAGGLDGWFTERWAETLNFTNVTSASEEGSMPVNAEQLLAWDPDVILVTGKGMSSMTAVEILNNQVPGIDLSSLRAVRNREVYTTELGMWNWFTPGPDAPVVANWIGSKLYPDQFADVDLITMTQDYYQQMYGHQVSKERAATIVDPDAGAR